MAETEIRVYRGANAPAVMLAVPNADLTGSAVEIDVRWSGGVLHLSSAAGDLVVQTHAISWAYTTAQSAMIPLGRLATFDAFRVLGGMREKIGAGRIVGVGDGAMPDPSAVALRVPGVQGPRGDKGDTGDVTPQAEAARAAAQGFAATASGGAVTSTDKAAVATAAAAAAASDRAATGQDRVAVAADRVVADAKAGEAAGSAAMAAAAATTISAPSWAALSALVGTFAGQRATVGAADAGTHADPVVGGTVANAGVYGWSTAPAGWRRDGALPPMAIASVAAARAGTNNTDAVTPAGLAAVAAPIAEQAFGSLDPDSIDTSVLHAFVDGAGREYGCVTLDGAFDIALARVRTKDGIEAFFYETLDPDAAPFQNWDANGRVIPNPALAALAASAVTVEFYETLDPAALLILDPAGRELVRVDKPGDLTAVKAEVAAARGNRVSIAARSAQYTDDYGMPRRHLHGEWRLRRTRQKLQALAQGDNVQFTWAAHGDSWSHIRDRYVAPVLSRLVAEYGDAGGGWIGFAAFGAGGTNGAARAAYTMVRTGTWTDSYNNTASPDLGTAISAAAGSAIALTGPALPALSAAVLHWIGTADGILRYRWNNGAWTPLNVQGAARQTAALPTGMPASGAWTLDIEVVSGTCQLCGIDMQSTARGVRGHKLGCSGSGASNWVTPDAAQWQAGYALLAPDLATIMLGTNDRTGNKVPSTVAADLGALVDRIRAAVPGAGTPPIDVLVIMPPQSAEVGPTYPMSAYAAEIYRLADARDFAFLDLQYLVGLPGTYGAWLTADLRHPDIPTMGRAITDALWRILTQI